MSTTVNTGWLKDNNGDKFAPKTLSSQVINSDGVSIDQLLANMGSGTIELDTTLLAEGMAADAKAVGDALNIKQNKITGTAGQFVIIGADGNVTTKTIANAEEVGF